VSTKYSWLTVTKYEVHALLADQVGERNHVLPEVVDLAVHQITDDRYDGGPLCVDPVRAR
jgi:hypothetical protein